LSSKLTFVALDYKQRNYFVSGVEKVSTSNTHQTNIWRTNFKTGEERKWIEQGKAYIIEYMPLQSFTTAQT